MACIQHYRNGRPGSDIRILVKFHVKGVKAPNLFILYKYIYKYIERKSQRYIYMYVAVVLLSLSANSDGHETPKHILPFVSMHCVLSVAGCL